MIFSESSIPSLHCVDMHFQNHVDSTGKQTLKDGTWDFPNAPPTGMLCLCDIYVASSPSPTPPRQYTHG